MTELFLFLFRQAVSASWLILFVLLIRAAFPKCPRWFICILWGLCALRLVLPHVPEAPFSVFVSRTDVLPGAGLTIAESAFSGAGTAADLMDGAAGGSGLADVQSAAAGISPLSILAWVWLAGIILLLFAGVMQYALLKRRLAEAVPDENGCRISDQIDVPFLFGLIHPKIYLPIAVHPADADWIFRHEKAHIARLDVWWKLLGWLFVCMFWMDPLIWIAWHFFVKDLEMACDEKVIRNLDAQQIQSYCHALVNVSSRKRSTSFHPLAFGETGVKSRIKNMLQGGRKMLWIGIAAACTILCLFLGLANDSKSGSVEANELSDLTDGASMPSFYADNLSAFAAVKASFEDNMWKLDGSPAMIVVLPEDIFLMPQSSFSLKSAHIVRASAGRDSSWESLTPMECDDLTEEIMASGNTASQTDLDEWDAQLAEAGVRISDQSPEWTYQKEKIGHLVDPFYGMGKDSSAGGAQLTIVRNSSGRITSVDVSGAAQSGWQEG